MTSPDLELVRQDARYPARDVETARRLSSALNVSVSDVMRMALERGLMVLARDGVQPMEAYAADRKIGLR